MASDPCMPTERHGGLRVDQMTYHDAATNWSMQVIESSNVIEHDSNTLERSFSSLNVLPQILLDTRRIAFLKQWL
ncbi:hypothetical protein CEXT_609031 [Caerostris extrusa]|uniref:Uncharacterized protein n=1 Tax=Caerostris extrusa TaxID=172846 RepID=A0AAV4M512_CAEEX|nr:hypothetical protein CEXT_609031 [Caerostris extrusa]